MWTSSDRLYPFITQEASRRPQLRSMALNCVRLCSFRLPPVAQPSSADVSLSTVSLAGEPTSGTSLRADDAIPNFGDCGPRQSTGGAQQCRYVPDPCLWPFPFGLGPAGSAFFRVVTPPNPHQDPQGNSGSFMAAKLPNAVGISCRQCPLPPPSNCRTAENRLTPGGRPPTEVPTGPFSTWRLSCHRPLKMLVPLIMLGSG